MEIRKLTGKDRETCQKLMRYAFTTSMNSYEDLEYPNEKIPMDWYHGAFEKNLLIACAGSIPFDIRLRSSDFKMGGVMGVATKPEYRNRGIIRKIIVKMFKDMYDSNIPISVLYPFKVAFYEMLGYKLVDEIIYYQFKISDIITKKTSYSMQEVEQINDDIRKVYDKAILNFDYIAKRPSINSWWTHFKGNYKFICYNGDEPVGYILISFPTINLLTGRLLTGRLASPERTIIINETFWLNQTAKQTIFNFLWSHRDQRKYVVGGFSESEIIIDLLKTPRVKVRQTTANSLLRIIDIKTVLKNIEYPIDNFTISLHIHDEYCPWNDGIFILKSEGKSIEVEYMKSSMTADIELDIGHLAQLIGGFRTVYDLLKFNFISIKKDKFELLEALFPKKNNFMCDHF
ncbi:MAG: enhanced intracellular survival protein Eis [Promethearchaeota archaeon]